MNKKILWIFLLLGLFISLPAFQGNATLSPEEAIALTSKRENETNSITTDGTHEYGNDVIEVIEQTDQTTQILMNDTYQIDLLHNDTNLGVTCTKLDTGLTPMADEMLFDIDFEISPAGQFMDIALPSGIISIDHSNEDDDLWEVMINELLLVELNTTEHSLYFSNGTHSVYVEDGFIEFVGPDPASTFLIEQISTDEWIILTPDGPLLIFFNGSHLALDFMGGPIFPFGPIPGAPFVFTGPFVWIDFLQNSVGVEWGDVSISLQHDVITIYYGVITIIWYYLLIIQTIVILFWDLTIIFYLTIIELLIVIIYESFEIKIYEYQLVIVYEYIELVILFVSIFIWQFTFIFHFEFWFIQIIYIIDISIHIIITPIRFIFIPIVIPIFIPIIYYIPVYILAFIHIYLPYAAQEMFIDVYNEDLQMPNHTISYYVYDQSGNPINDASVTVNYNGTDYSAIFVANGVYEVEIPASNVTETITVTATKQWYPDATLTYDLTVDWISDTVTTTVTEEGALPIVPILASLLSVSVCALVINRKKRN